MKAVAFADRFPQRVRFATMSVRELHGLIGNRQEHLRDNLRNGVYKNCPEFLDGLLYAFQTRKYELEDYRIEYASRPKLAAVVNAAKRREEVGPNGETIATHDFVTEKHKTGGKGQMVSAGTWVKRQSSSSSAC